jgi:hypothetical protein
MRKAEPIDLERLMKLRLVVARFGEMDAARWWNTGNAERRSAMLGRAGGLLMSRGFPKTHRFAQARLVFAVAKARCAEVFDPPGSLTLWSLPAEIEEQFDARWASWLSEPQGWDEVFRRLEPTPSPDLLALMRDLGLIEPLQAEAVEKLRRSAEGRAVLLPEVVNVDDEVVTLLAAGFSRGEPGKPAIPYA